LTTPAPTCTAQHAQHSDQGVILHFHPPILQIHQTNALQMALQM
jgi:hypothetical protein